MSGFLLGDDWLIGGKGADILKGGAGFDLASYLYAVPGVTINLITGIHTGDAEGDVFDSIEQIEGSEQNDTLISNSDGHTFIGGKGNDSLYGNGGVDILDGGLGDDYIEGGTEDDVIYGNLGSDTLHGNEGNDYLEAGDSNDSIFGASNDSVLGGSGDDTLLPGWGEDTVDGGADTDTLIIDYSTLPTAGVIWGQRNPEDNFFYTYMNNAYGMNNPPITIGSDFTGKAAISADGKTLAWGGFVQKLEEDDQPIDIGYSATYQFSLSEDGSKIAFSSGSKVYVSNSDGTNLIEITNREQEVQKLTEIFGQISTTSGGFDNLIISGDGSKVTWTFSPENTSSIGVANTDGSGEIIRITGRWTANTDSTVRDPFISADGSKIAWISSGVVMIANSDFSDMKQISVTSTDGYNKDNVGNVSLSADGSLVAWSQSGYSNSQPFNKIFVASPNSDPIERLEMDDDIHSFSNLSLSPDGEHIFYLKALSDNNYGLFVANTDGTNVPIKIASASHYTDFRIIYDQGSSSGRVRK